MQINISLDRPSRILRFGLIALLIVIAYRMGTATNGISRATLDVFATTFLSVFIEAVPFLLIGTIVSGFMEVFLKPEWVSRFIPRRALPATLVGVLLGFIFPVCECGVVPVVRRLLRKGVPASVAIAFLLAAPVMNPVVLASTAMAFGFGKLLVARFVITAIVAIAIGLFLTRRWNLSEANLLINAETKDCQNGSCADCHPQPFGSRIQRAFAHAGNEFFEMGFYLILGTLVATFLQMRVPYGQFFSLAEGLFTSVIMMQTLAFILSVCSTVDAFIALGYAGTFTFGSIVAFLTFGPMIDIKSTLMFFRVFKRRVVFELILLIFLLTLIPAVLINLLGISY